MKTTLSLLALAAMAASSQAAIITLWDFNSQPSDANTGTGTLSPKVGAGTAALLGGATSTFASGNSGTGSTDPEVADDAAWNLSTWAAQGTGSGTRGARFDVSTVGQKNIVVQWDNRHSNTVSKFIKFEYTTDGTNFSSVGLLNGGVFEATSGDTWFNDRTVDLSAIAGVNNNANFGFRVTTIFAPSTSAYVSSSGAAYGTTGTLRFDMVEVAGSPVPEPASIAAIGLGLAAISRRRNKK